MVGEGEGAVKKDLLHAAVSKSGKSRDRAIERLCTHHALQNFMHAPARLPATSPEASSFSRP
jgi:hypothetical protein